MRRWAWLLLVGCTAAGVPAVSPPPPPTTTTTTTAAGAPALTLDDVIPGDLARRPALDQVAAAAARTAADDHVVSAHALRAAMAAEVGSGMWPHVLAAAGTEAEIATQLASQLGELRSSVALGEVGLATATGSTGRVGVVIALPPPPLPIDVTHTGDAGRIEMAWPWAGEPAAYAVGPTSTWRLDAAAVIRAGDRLALSIDCTRPAAIEVWAAAELVATVVDACGEPVPYDPVGALDVGPPARTRVELERRIFELLNRDRAAQARPPLVWDEDTHRFAREHAAEMARSGRVGHEAADGASLSRRLERTRIAFHVARENVGHAWGPGEVSAAFMASPGHRANLLADDVARGSVGVVLDPADPHAFYVTQFFRGP